MPLLYTPGARVSYSRTGLGEPVLLIQGVGAIGHAWRPQVVALRERYSVITYDNRGVGGSSITDSTSLTIESMADDARAILDAEGIGRCHVVGHSMGGLIATQLALMSPRRVKSLTLLCTFPDGKSGSRLTWDTLWTGIRTRIGTRRMRRKAFLSLVISKAGLRGDPDGLAEEMTSLFGRDLAEQPPIIMRQLKAMSRFDPTWRLRSLAPIRTLVVSGEEDRIALPAYGRKLAASIPGSLYLEIPKAAHAVPIESPGMINRLIVEHLSQARPKVAS